jgi:hypothetical protein
MIHTLQSRRALPELRLATRFDTISIKLPWARGLSSMLPLSSPRHILQRRIVLPLTPMPALPS